MDSLDQSLEGSSPEKTNDSATSDEASQMHSDDGGVEHVTAINSISSQSPLLDPGVQYHLRTENGQGGAVTYRVVHLAHAQDVASEDGAHVVATSGAALVGQQVAQAIITNPFPSANGSGSPTTENQSPETRFTFLPTSSIDDATPQHEAAVLTSTTGQFYVMMSPQEVLQTGQRNLAPRAHQFSPKNEGPKAPRDERRRATHNEVERRRRDKINTWIIKLSKIVPECASDSTKQGQSKGGILAKTCDYINELRTTSAKIPELLKEKEQLTVELELLRQQCEDLMNQNQKLRAHLQQHGINIGSLGNNTR